MQSGSVNTGNKINDFVQRNRKAIYIGMGVIIFLVAAFVVSVSLNDFFMKKSIGRVEELAQEFSDIQSSLNEDDKQDAVRKLLDDLNEFAKNKRGFAAGRALSITGQIHWEREEWSLAEEAFRSAAKSASKTYLAPAALYNAGACAEEQGNLEQAIELYTACVSHPFEYPAAVRAQFAVGRLNEKSENITAALEAYRSLLGKWPHLTVWTNLAQSRIASLETR